MRPGALTRLAFGDFLDRARKPAYAVTLIAAVGLGYLAAPDQGAKFAIVQVGNYRGLYNSAYIGMATAFAGALWLTLAGFYVVCNAVARDESTRVGQLLAATPLRTSTYVAAKFLSNFLVLSSMVGVLAVTALVMQLARDEVGSVDPGALLLPFVLIALPLMAMTAGAALLFETLPVLRTGLGNIVWFFVWMVVAVAGQGEKAPLGGIGVHDVVESMREQMQAQGLDTSGGFSLGLTLLDAPLRTFEWSGFTPDAGYLATRLAVIALAVVTALVPVLWFTRFDPARVAAPLRGGDTTTTEAHATPAQLSDLSPVREEYAPTSATAPKTLPTTPVRSGGAGLRLFIGELRILIQGVPLYWWLGTAAITVVALAVPISAVSRAALPAAWIWPVLVWSRLGTQQHEYGVESLLGAYPTVRRRVLAEWAAGLTLTVAVGLGPLLRFAVAADPQGVAAWVGGALLIPSLALALGVLGRTHRLFQAIYLPLWYSAVNGFPVLDYMGTVRAADGALNGPSPLAVAGVAVILVAVVFATAAARRARA
ncbi:ABC transporter permease [Streptomyces caelestis]|uniref:hypothetical protein n=1 Tax=Streptomyces caelestis TaxID=36816 RepID=UPI0036F66792